MRCARLRPGVRVKRIDTTPVPRRSIPVRLTTMLIFRGPAAGFLKSFTLIKIDGEPAANYLCSMLIPKHRGHFYALRSFTPRCQSQAHRNDPGAAPRAMDLSAEHTGRLHADRLLGRKGKDTVQEALIKRRECERMELTLCG